MTDIPGLLPTGAVLSALPLSSSPTLAGGGCHFSRLEENVIVGFALHETSRVNSASPLFDGLDMSFRFNTSGIWS